MIDETDPPDAPDAASSENKINNPHDSFFREMMREPKVYRPFIKKFLPADILKKLDLRTIKPVDDHFVSESLRHLYTDSLYRVRTKLKSEVVIYFLVEHFSKPDYWSAFRAWHYAFAAWDDVIRKLGGKQGKLPLIIPVLFYIGEIGL